MRHCTEQKDPEEIKSLFKYFWLNLFSGHSDGQDDKQNNCFAKRTDVIHGAVWGKIYG